MACRVVALQLCLVGTMHMSAVNCSDSCTLRVRGWRVADARAASVV